MSDVDPIAEKVRVFIDNGRKMLDGSLVDESAFRVWSVGVRCCLSDIYGVDSKQEKDFDDYGRVFVVPLDDDPHWQEQHRREALKKRVDFLEGISSYQPTRTVGSFPTPVEQKATDIGDVTVAWLRHHSSVKFWVRVVGAFLGVFIAGVVVGHTTPLVAEILKKLVWLWNLSGL